LVVNDVLSGLIKPAKYWKFNLIMHICISWKS